MPTSIAFNLFNIFCQTTTLLKYSMFKTEVTRLYYDRSVEKSDQSSKWKQFSNMSQGHSVVVSLTLIHRLRWIRNTSPL